MVLAECVYHALKRWRGEENRSTTLLALGFILAVAWVYLALYAYAS